MTNTRLLINVDVGEGFAHDQQLIKIADQVNICCGVHAGSPELAKQTVNECQNRNRTFGAHPSLPDRTNFGRGRLMPFNREYWLMSRKSITNQIDLLVTLGASYVKPHGELYNASATRQDAGELLASCLQKYNLPLMGLPGTLHEEVARSLGLPLIREGFADRRYQSDGTLVPRTEPNAVIETLAEVQENLATLQNKVDTICIHGDTENCEEFALFVRGVLDTA